MDIPGDSGQGVPPPLVSPAASAILRRRGIKERRIGECPEIQRHRLGRIREVAFFLADGGCAAFFPDCGTIFLQKIIFSDRSAFPIVVGK